MYTWRRIPWRLLAGAWAVCAAVSTARLMAADSAIELLPFVRLSSVTFAAIAVFALEDPAASVTESTLAGRLELRVTAAAAMALAVLPAWLSIVLYARAAAGNPDELPIPGLLVELVALSAAGWAIAAGMGRAAAGIDAPARAAAVLVMLVALTLTTPRLVHSLWVGPGSEWHRSHVRWAVIAAAASIAFVWISRDPARRPIRRRRP
jgi:hypothetical protein